jgi:hypothetical protein
MSDTSLLTIATGKTWTTLGRCLVAAAVAFVCAAPSPARADCSSLVTAYADARKAFEEKRYMESVEQLRRLYACDPNPAYLSNIARAYEEAGERKQAVAAWREYQLATPDEHEKKVTQGRISSLLKVLADMDRLEREKAAAEEAKRRAEASAQPDSAPAEGRHVSTAAWVITGAGALGLATGTVLGVMALSKKSSAEKEPDVVRAESIFGDGKNFAHAANWAFAIGAGATAVGLGWIGVDLFVASPQKKATVGVVVSGTSVGISGAF